MSTTDHNGARGAEVTVTDAVRSYGPVQALRGISIHVLPSEFVAITGPSGSGKSTLLNLIGSLDIPDAGAVHVDGRPVPEPRDAVDFRRRIVGFVFQDNLLLPYLSAQENIEAALLGARISRQQRRERSSELLQEVGLTHRADHLPAELSGGQRQAVALARALANHPRLLLADEPTGSLDSASADRALTLLQTLRERYGTTVIVVSHDPEVSKRADRTIQLADGQLAMNGHQPATPVALPPPMPGAPVAPPAAAYPAAPQPAYQAPPPYPYAAPYPYAMPYPYPPPYPYAPPPYQGPPYQAPYPYPPPPYAPPPQPQDPQQEPPAPHTDGAPAPDPQPSADGAEPAHPAPNPYAPPQTQPPPVQPPHTQPPPVQPPDGQAPPAQPPVPYVPPPHQPPAIPSRFTQAPRRRRRRFW
jgi:ABC-type lipoprotein export system ATPase subunit